MLKRWDMPSLRVMFALLTGISLSGASLADAKLNRPGTVPRDVQRSVRKSAQQALAQGQALRVRDENAGGHEVVSVTGPTVPGHYLKDGTYVTAKTHRYSQVPLDAKGGMRDGDGLSRSMTRGKQFWSMQKVDGEVYENHAFTAGKKNRYVKMNLGFQPGDRLEEHAVTKDGVTRRYIRDAVIRTRDVEGKKLPHPVALSGRPALNVELK